MAKFLGENCKNHYIIITTLFLLGVLYGCSEKKVRNTKTTDEVSQIRKPILNLYQSLKVENGITPDFEYVFSLFTKTGRLGYVKEDSLILKSPEAYFSGMQAGIATGAIKLLHEWEIKGKTEYFGNIAHHISTYGVYFGTTDSIAERGVTSFQLVNIKGDWKIQSMIWKAESENLRIPLNYLEN
jgi:hypothetical protein